MKKILLLSISLILSISCRLSCAESSASIDTTIAAGGQPYELVGINIYYVSMNSIYDVIIYSRDKFFKAPFTGPDSIIHVPPKAGYYIAVSGIRGIKNGINEGGRRFSTCNNLQQINSDAKQATIIIIQDGSANAICDTYQSPYFMY